MILLQDMNTNKIEFYIYLGKKDKYWYAECQQVFEELFGKDRLELVCSLFAATSINTSLKSNIRLFRKAYYEMMNELPIGNYLPNIKRQLERIRSGKEISGPKITSFMRAMSGDINAVVVDTWILRAFGVNKVYFRQTKGKPEGVGRERSAGTDMKTYCKIEDWVRNYAAMIDAEPRQVSAMIWAGIRIDQTGDTNTHYKEILLNKMTNLFNCI